MLFLPNITGVKFLAGFSLSKSNVLVGQTPTITSAGVGEIASNISDPDHSLNYTCGTAAEAFTVSYGSQTNISYVAISGHTAARPANAVIELYDNNTLIDSVTLKRNNNVMFTFTSRSFTDLEIRFLTSPNTYQMTVSFIAAGQHIIIAKGEQAGYNRQWLNRHTTQKTTTNMVVAPVSTITKSKALKGMLSLPNEELEFVRDEWQEFIDFSEQQPFFIKEDQLTPESSYICYDPTSTIKAHPTAPLLGVLQLKYTCFNGL